MSDFAAFYIASVVGVWLAPWYIAIVFGLGLLGAFVKELP